MRHVYETSGLMTQQAMRAPACPVVVLSLKPPRPRSSSPLCICRSQPTIVTHRPLVADTALCAENISTTSLILRLPRSVRDYLLKQSSYLCGDRYKATSGVTRTSGPLDKYPSRALPPLSLSSAAAYLLFPPHFHPSLSLHVLSS